MKKITAAFLLLVNCGAWAAAEFHASNELAFTSNELAGPGKASSSLTRGPNFVDTLNLYGNGAAREEAPRDCLRLTRGIAGLEAAPSG